MGGIVGTIGIAFAGILADGDPEVARGLFRSSSARLRRRRAPCVLADARPSGKHGGLLVGNLLRARRMPAAVAVAQWLGVGTTVVGIALLAPEYGLEGAAVASALGQSVCLLASLIALRRARVFAEQAE